jgi:hypothetical protein
MHDWQVLGLAEPTDELTLIKRSYAAKLKLTLRPQKKLIVWLRKKPRLKERRQRKRRCSEKPKKMRPELKRRKRKIMPRVNGAAGALLRKRVVKARKAQQISCKRYL